MNSDDNFNEPNDVNNAPAWAMALLQRVSALEGISRPVDGVPFISTCDPDTEFSPYTEFREALPGFANDFFRHPLSDIERKRFLSACPREYMPPTLNQISMGTATKRIDHQFHDPVSPVRHHKATGLFPSPHSPFWGPSSTRSDSGINQRGTSHNCALTICIVLRGFLMLLLEWARKDHHIWWSPKTWLNKLPSPAQCTRRPNDVKPRTTKKGKAHPFRPKHQSMNKNNKDDPRICPNKATAKTRRRIFAPAHGTHMAKGMTTRNRWPSLLLPTSMADS
ncbi:hypothetical protein BX666DRAFT_1893552, partial [Dichotomocladium elegans]